LTASVCAMKRMSGAGFMVVSSTEGIDLVGSPPRGVGCDALEGGVAERELARQEPVSICRSPVGPLVSTPPEVHVRAHDRHLVAVARTFGCAEAAAGGDHADALSAVGAVEADRRSDPDRIPGQSPSVAHRSRRETREKRGLVMTDWRSGETPRGS
jgi:hypothetical protein